MSWRRNFENPLNSVRWDPLLLFFACEVKRRVLLSPSSPKVRMINFWTSPPQYSSNSKWFWAQISLDEILAVPKRCSDTLHNDDSARQLCNANGSLLPKKKQSVYHGVVLSFRPFIDLNSDFVISHGVNAFIGNSTQKTKLWGTSFK